MRQLKPEVAQNRKNSLLQWAIHYYIKTSKPVSSSAIAEEADFDLSSATIRNILQELEEDGYLRQPHTSSGREPTDKGYRFFVDYLTGVQRLASGEKEKIDREYKNRIEELDTLLVETSKLLSKVSHGAGIVLSSQMRNQALKRLELIHLGGRNVLGILVTEAGFVRHWPIRLGFEPSSRQINILNRFLNDSVQGLSISQAKGIVMTGLKQMESEFRELNVFAGELLREVGHALGGDELYIEGTDNILSHVSEIGDMGAVQSLMRMIGEKDAIVGLLEDQLNEKLDENGPAGALRPQVRIGAESGIPELRGLSLVTKTYRHKNRVVGVLGVLGSKRMEYSKMMSLVDYLSGLVSHRIHSWDEDEEGV